MKCQVIPRKHFFVLLLICQLLPFTQPFNRDNGVTRLYAQTSTIVASKPTSRDTHGSDISKQIESMLREHSYELSIRPERNGDPTHVGLNLLIESITDISEKNMDVTFTLCLHETWRDERLRFKSETENASIVLASRLIDKIWVPDLYLVGSKSSFVHKTTVDNVVLRLFSDGTVFYSLKITTTIACQMNLYNFPLDIENCSIVFRSLGYTSDELLLHWSGMTEKKDSLFMDVRLVKNMPKYQLLHHKFHSSNVTWSEIHLAPNTKRSQLRITFELRRYPLSVFFQSYFPAMAMVMLSGLGMWIDPRSVPARVALGVTSLLTISTIITGLKATLPKVSYLTAMDIYLWVCFLFVFSTVIEFCVLNYMMTEKKRKTSRKETLDQRKFVSFPEACNLRKTTTCGYQPSCDFLFRISYFIAFIAFNVTYWVYYACITQHDGNDG